MMISDSSLLFGPPFISNLCGPVDNHKCYK